MKKKNAVKENYKLKGIYNLLANGINYITGLGIAFIVSPIIIRGLGDTFYGIWKVLNQLTGYLNTVEFQTTDTLKWVVANKRSELEKEELRKEVSAALIVATLIIPFFIVGGTILIYYAPTIANVTDEYHEIVRLTMTILVCGFILKKYTSIPLAVLKGMNLGYKKVGLQAFLQVLSGALNVYVILYTEFGIIGLATVNVIIAIFGGALFLYYVKKYVPWFGLSKPNKDKVYEFFKTSGWLFLWTIASLALVSTDLVLLGYLAAPALVTIYVVTKFLPEILKGVTTIVRGALLPGFGNLIGNKELIKAEKARNLLMLTTWIICVSLGAAILVVSNSFVAIWVGEERYGGDIITLFILLITIQYIFIKTDSMIIVTSLSLKENFTITLLAALTSVGFKFLLIPEYGIIGLCISLLAGRLILSITMPVLLNKIISIKTSFLKLIRPLLFTILIFSVSYYLSQFVLLDSYLTIGIVFSFIALLTLGIVIGLGTTDRQRVELIGVAKSIRNKIK